MPDETQTDANSQEDQSTGFDDLVGKEQSVNSINSNQGAPEGEQPETKTEVKEPEDGQANANNPEDGQKTEEKFWGKFNTPDEAKKSYDEAQGKIIEQGTKLNELTKANEESTKLLSAIETALAKNPELAEQLKTAIAATGEVQEKEDGDIDSLIDKKIEAREQQKQTKEAREKWIGEHPDFSENNGELGHKILDLIEQEGLPVTAKTLQMAYDHLTKDSSIEAAKKTATEEALKKEDIANLDREKGSSVGGGDSAADKEPTSENPFDNLVGSTINPNSIRA